MLCNLSKSGVSNQKRTEENFRGQTVYKGAGYALPACQQLMLLAQVLMLVAPAPAPPHQCYCAYAYNRDRNLLLAGKTHACEDKFRCRQFKTVASENLEFVTGVLEVS